MTRSRSCTCAWKTLGSRPRRITVTYYAEWVLGTTRDLTQQYIVPEFDAEHHALLARNPYSIEFGGRVMPFSPPASRSTA